MKSASFSRAAGYMAMTALAVAPAFAVTDYSWKSAQDGDWSNPDNWTSKAGAKTADRVISLPSGNYTVRLTEDVTIGSIYLWNNSGIGTRVLDLNSYTLKQTLVAYNGFAWSAGGTPIEPCQLTGNDKLLVKNGTFYIGGGVIGTYTGGGAFIDFSNVAVQEYFWECNGSTRIILRDGSVWTATKDQDVGPSYDRDTTKIKYPYFCVTGETSRIDSADYNLGIHTFGAGLFVLDGATAAYKNVRIGDTYRSTNCLVRVDSATLTVGESILLGTDDIRQTGTYHSEKPLSWGSTLEVGGKGARVTASSLVVYEKTKSCLSFNVPSEGFETAPLHVTSLLLFARDPAYDDFGATSLKITCYDWASTHPCETIPLAVFESASAAALDDVTNQVVWADYPVALVEQGKTPTVSLAADGKTLQVTAPEINLKPVIGVSVEPGGEYGTKVVNIHISDYGFGATGISTLTCEYADNSEFNDSVATNFLQGLGPITAVTPCDVSFVLRGEFVQHENYYLRVIATNDGSQPSDVQEESFVGDALAETLSWSGTVVNGDWQDADNWNYADGTPARTYPRGEDTINWIGSRTVSLVENAAFVRYASSITAGHLVFEMNGYDLTSTDVRTTSDPSVFAINSAGVAKENFEPVGAALEFRNGTFYATNRVNNTIYTGLMLGYCQGGSHGTLILDDHAVLNMAVKYMNNSSRIFVKGGSVLNELGRDLVMQGHTARNPNPLLCVTGENSRVSFPNYTVRIRGLGGACYIQQGASVEAKAFDIGGTNFCWGAGTDGVTGQIYSTNTHVHVENATLAVKQNLTIGWSNDAQCAPRLVMNGTGTTVSVGGTLKIHGGLAAALEYELPVEGFASDPLTANALELVARPSGNTDYGATQIKLRGLKAWAKANPKASVNLIKLTEPNADGLSALKASAVLDWDKLTSDCLSVSADGTALVLTAPPRPGLIMIVQ